jgi:hypothetical protein
MSNKKTTSNVNLAIIEELKKTFVGKIIVVHFVMMCTSALKLLSICCALIGRLVDTQGDGQVYLKILDLFVLDLLLLHS